MTTPACGRGAPEPLGVTFMDGGVNVAVASVHADAVLVCLFDANGGETARHRLPGRTGEVFHGHLPGIQAGQRYGLRVEGPYDPLHGHRFNPAKLLVDPYATALDRPFHLHPSMFGYRRDDPAADLSLDPADSAPFMPKALMLPTLDAAASAPRVPWEHTILYELHVRGFTRLHTSVPEAMRGTFAGLRQPAVLEHLVRLGVTTLEILPAMAWLDERHLPPLGLTNYWGYNPVALMVPDPRLAPGGWADVQATVDAVHAAGMEIVLDVVLNHTGEGDELGPTVSLRGLDNATYYRLIPGQPRYHVNETGTGNTLALDRPPVLRLAMDSLRAWARLAGLDGFRFDLATTLGRRADGFDPTAPLLAAISQDPELRRLKLIAEPWDVGPGGYQLGAFPQQWGEWNDRFRDTARRFWRGDRGQVAALATRIAGSADVFADRHRPPSRGINFVTAHDGFTLADLVAFAHKHNGANGEDNRDGTDDNISWNNGAEGPTEDPAIRARRAADARAILTTLLAARGTPMLQAGDETGRSQGGNNNAYAQDTPVSWLDWPSADAALTEFAARLIALRRTHPALHRDRTLDSAEVQWLRPDGTPMRLADWQDPGAATLIALFDDQDTGDRAMLVLHAGDAPLQVTLPNAGSGRVWRVMVDSADPVRHTDGAPTPVAFAARSAAILVAC